MLYIGFFLTTKIVSEYDQEIPQSQTADKPVASLGRATQKSRDTRKTTKQSNQLSIPHRGDCLISSTIGI